MFLPSAAPIVTKPGPLRVLPAGTESRGDYYDFLEFPESRFGIAIGDVSGKGMGAALIMAPTRAWSGAHLTSVLKVAARVISLLMGPTPSSVFTSLMLPALLFTPLPIFASVSPVTAASPVRGFLMITIAVAIIVVASIAIVSVLRVSNLRHDCGGCCKEQ